MTLSERQKLFRVGCLLVLLAVFGPPSVGAQEATSSTAPDPAPAESLVILGTAASEQAASDGQPAADEPGSNSDTNGSQASAGQPAGQQRSPVEALQGQPEILAKDFAVAVEDYRRGDYVGALQVFGRLAAAEPDARRRAVLHANAGTAAARAGELGLAVWHLEAALRNQPRDDTARRNLDQVRARLGQPSLSAASFTESLLRLPLWMSRSETVQLVGIVAALVLVLLCLRRRSPRAVGRVAWTLAILGVLGVAFTAMARGRDLERAVVVQGIAVRAEPDETGKLLFRLDGGSIVRAEDRRGDWQLVETEAGGRGWAPAASVKLAGF